MPSSRFIGKAVSRESRESEPVPIYQESIGVLYPEELRTGWETCTYE